MAIKDKIMEPSGPKVGDEVKVLTDDAAFTEDAVVTRVHDMKTVDVHVYAPEAEVRALSRVTMCANEDEARAAMADGVRAAFK